MQVKDAVEEYRYAISRHSEQTQSWYLSKLKAFALWCEIEVLVLEKIKPSDIGRYIDVLRKQINPRTQKPLTSYTLNGYARTIKTFLNWCSKEEGIEDLVSSRLPKRIAMPKIDHKVIEIFTEDQLKALFVACEREYTPILTARDKAILSVLLDTGIRISELCGLTLDCTHLDAQDGYLKVMGKGRKEREVGLGKLARTALYRYITRYRKAPKDEQHVFLSRFNKPLTVNGLDQVLYRLAEWARINGVRCSAHTFRHTYAVNFLKANGDVYRLSRLMGHTNVSVTEVYLKALKGREARQGGISVLDSLK